MKQLIILVVGAISATAFAFLAHAVTFTVPLTGTATTASSGGAPAIAATAGFTTQIINVDFPSMTSGQASSWPGQNVVGCGASASVPGQPSTWHWYYTIIFGPSGSLPCADSQVQMDNGVSPAVQALHLTLQPSEWAAGQTSFMFPQTWHPGLSGATYDDWLPNQIYWKYTIRIPSNAWNSAGQYTDVWQTTNCDPATGGCNAGHGGDALDHDFMESIDGSGGGGAWNGQSGTWASGIGYLSNSAGSGISDSLNVWYDPGGVPTYTYHTFEMLVTADNTTSWLCHFEDGVAEGCENSGGGSKNSNVTLHNNIFGPSIWTWSGSAPSVPLEVWVSHVEGWSCTNYMTEGACLTTSPITHWPWP